MDASDDPHWVSVHFQLTRALLHHAVGRDGVPAYCLQQAEDHPEAAPAWRQAAREWQPAETGPTGLARAEHADAAAPPISRVHLIGVSEGFVEYDTKDEAEATKRGWEQEHGPRTAYIEGAEQDAAAAEDTESPLDWEGKAMHDAAARLSPQDFARQRGPEQHTPSLLQRVAHLRTRWQAQTKQTERGMER